MMTGGVKIGIQARITVVNADGTSYTTDAVTEEDITRAEAEEISKVTGVAINETQKED